MNMSCNNMISSDKFLDPLCTPLCNLFNSEVIIEETIETQLKYNESRR